MLTNNSSSAQQQQPRRMPLGKMKWLGHWVQGFKCSKIYFQIAFANHIKYKYVFPFLVLLFSYCYMSVFSVHRIMFICRWCYGTWLIVFAFDFHSIKFLFSTPTHQQPWWTRANTLPWHKTQVDVHVQYKFEQFATIEKIFLTNDDAKIGSFEKC